MYAQKHVTYRIFSFYLNLLQLVAYIRERNYVFIVEAFRAESDAVELAVAKIYSAGAGAAGAH